MRQVGRYRALHGVASSIGWGSALGRRRGASTPPVVRPNQVARTALYVVSTIHTVASGAFLPPLPKRCRAGGRPEKPVQRCEIRPSCWPSSSPHPKTSQPVPPPSRYADRWVLRWGWGALPLPSFPFLKPVQSAVVSASVRCVGRVHRAPQRRTIAQSSATHGPLRVSHLLPSDV